MVDYMPEDDKHQQSEAIQGFYIHFLVYAAVIAGLFLINLFSGGPLWAQWPAIGWGIGIIGHWYGVFISLPKRLQRQAAGHRQLSDKTENPHH
jgi:2TM domain